MAIRRPNGRWIVSCLPSGDWHREEIKAAVRMKGSTLEELSRADGLPLHACRLAARRPHFWGELAIAKFLGLKPNEIWPSRFDSAGGRIPQVRSRRKSNPDLTSSTSQKLRRPTDTGVAA